MRIQSFTTIRATVRQNRIAFILLAVAIFVGSLVAAPVSQDWPLWQQMPFRAGVTIVALLVTYAVYGWHLRRGSHRRRH